MEPRQAGSSGYVLTSTAERFLLPDKMMSNQKAHYDGWWTLKPCNIVQLELYHSQIPSSWLSWRCWRCNTAKSGIILRGWSLPHTDDVIIQLSNVRRAKGYLHMPHSALQFRTEQSQWVSSLGSPSWQSLSIEKQRLGIQKLDWKERESLLLQGQEFS